MVGRISTILKMRFQRRILLYYYSHFVEHRVSLCNCMVAGVVVETCLCAIKRPSKLVRRAIILLGDSDLGGRARCFKQIPMG